MPIASGSRVGERKANGRKGTVVGTATANMDIGNKRRGQWRVRWDDGTEENKTTNQLKIAQPADDPSAEAERARSEPLVLPGARRSGAKQSLPKHPAKGHKQSKAKGAAKKGK